MSDSPQADADDADDAEGARMELTPDTIHEGDTDDELSIDCPACGTTVPLSTIIYEGRCTGTLEGEVNEAESRDEELEGGCGAELSLELVWQA